MRTPLPRRSRRLTAALLALVLLGAAGVSTTGCAGIRATTERLKDTTRRFNENVRWQRFRAAGKSVLPAKRAAWVAAMERAAATFRVAEFEITPVQVDGDKAVLHVDLAYFREPNPTVQRMRRKQVWEKVDGDWMLATDVEVHLDAGPPPDAFPDLGGGDDTES